MMMKPACSVKTALNPAGAGLPNELVHTTALAAQSVAPSLRLNCRSSDMPAADFHHALQGQQCAHVHANDCSPAVLGEIRMSDYL